MRPSSLTMPIAAGRDVVNARTAEGGNQLLVSWPSSARVSTVPSSYVTVTSRHSVWFTTPCSVRLSPSVSSTTRSTMGISSSVTTISRESA